MECRVITPHGVVEDCDNIIPGATGNGVDSNSIRLVAHILYCSVYTDYKGLQRELTKFNKMLIKKNIKNVGVEN